MGFGQQTATLGGRAQSPWCVTSGILQTSPWGFLVSSSPHPNRLTVVLKGKEVWQKINPLAFQLILRCQRGWGQLGLNPE